MLIRKAGCKKIIKKLSQLNCQLAMIFIAVIPVYSISKLIWQCTVHFSLCTKINVKIFEGFLANDHPDQIKGAAKDHLRLTKGIMSMKNIYRTFIKKLHFVFSVFHFYCFRDFAEAFNKALDFRYKVAVLQTSRTNPQMWNLKKF